MISVINYHMHHQLAEVELCSGASQLLLVLQLLCTEPSGVSARVPSLLLARQEHHSPLEQRCWVLAAVAEV